MQHIHWPIIMMVLLHLLVYHLDTRILNTRQSLDLNSLHALEQETHNADTLWLILWQNHLTDPTSLIESMLVASCKRLPVSEIFTNVGVLRFDLTDCRPLDQITTPPIPLHVKFRTPIQLNGYDLQKSPNLWEVDLWWETTGPIEETYTVFVHLIDATGQIVAQHDHIAGADAYPTSQWHTGTALRDRFFLEVPGDGCDACSLHVGLYTDKQRVDLENGQDTIIIAIDH